MDGNVRPHRGRGGSWRRGGGDPAASEHRGRGRGGHHRGRGKRDHHHRGRGRGVGAADFRRVRDDVSDDPDSEDEGPSIFSRRKLESNSGRYEALEREESGQDVPVQRGTDFHALLGSAGDSFSQFRFSEEKDWEMDSLAANQMSALLVDLPALAQSLQELPLHERLNLEAELVQVATPVELPAMTVACKQDSAVRSGFKAPAPARPGHAVPPSTASTAETPADDADEELDRLLGLQDPVKGLSLDQSGDQTTAQHKEQKEVEMKKEEKYAPRDVPAAQNMTEEDLEDWLDSMIS
ncbi:cell death regulator Aven isoform X2 [Denticeps clupeoides]|uniref:cell death regulator Aven isoform X2 n=1 Tax=Denticeps clupeoides TaxID=299321 RepID=UPI0010A3BC2D|nr:cell death regulator Aven isoform X2 [Denticeps clupeoides]